MTARLNHPSPLGGDWSMFPDEDGFETNIIRFYTVVDTNHLPAHAVEAQYKSLIIPEMVKILREEADRLEDLWQ